VANESSQSIVDLGRELLELEADQAEWSRFVFGPDNVRGPVGPLKHMVKEIEKELLIHPDCLKDIEEWADLLILWLDARRRAGFSLIEIIRAAQDKMKKNRTREWPPFDQTKVNEAIEHIRKDVPVGQKCASCGKSFYCDNGRWFTTCDCAKEELLKRQ
jgi:hypothetical protein